MPVSYHDMENKKNRCARVDITDDFHEVGVMVAEKLEVVLTEVLAQGFLGIVIVFDEGIRNVGNPVFYQILEAQKKLHTLGGDLKLAQRGSEPKIMSSLARAELTELFKVFTNPYEAEDDLVIRK